MTTKQMIWIGVFVGSTIGGALPMLWGGSTFSFSSMFFGAVGAFTGIWLAYRLSQY